MSHPPSDLHTPLNREEDVMARPGPLRAQGGPLGAQPWAPKFQGPSGTPGASGAQGGRSTDQEPPAPLGQLNVSPVPLRAQAEVKGDDDVPPGCLMTQVEGQEQTRKKEEDDGKGHPELPLPRMSCSSQWSTRCFKLRKCCLPQWHCRATTFAEQDVNQLVLLGGPHGVTPIQTLDTVDNDYQLIH